MGASEPSLVDELRRAGVGRGGLAALVGGLPVGWAIAAPGGPVTALAGADGPMAVAALDEALRPRWVLWSQETAAALVGCGVRVATCWDIAAVQRLLFGGWRADPALVWAQLHDLVPESIPTLRPPDLFNQAADAAALEGGDEPVGPDGHLRPEWTGGGWSSTPHRLARWAELALSVARLQQDRLAATAGDGRAEVTARSESAAELLCAELAADGLPMDRPTAEEIIAGFVGPRPATEAEAVEQRRRRDDEVLRHAPAGGRADLRSPGQVKSLLRSVGLEVADTRAWRLETLREAHPLVGALLAWRKAERVATTYGYAWLDAHLHPDGRLRGTWSGADGAAGRMTASAGLHNMPADLRGAVVAEPGHVFVRADLAQIEPRVLAAVSRDAALARATFDDDLYASVAAQLGVDRATAKVAVLGAMYGQTTGHGAQALRRLQSAYPVAMAHLDDADRAAQGSRDLRTYGGRLIAMGWTNANEMTDREARSQAAARGRYGRNALIQGAAAELFKAWAATVRTRLAPTQARIVLCLHDELLVHAPTADGEATARLLDDCLQEAARRWARDDTVRFVADIRVLHRWSDAKS